MICTLVGLDTIGAVASNGAQGFTWLMFLGLAFFIPYAFLTAELGAAFTEEGGPYIWTKLALGRFVSGVNAIIYWISNPIWLGGTLTITAVSVFNEFFYNLGNGQYIFGLIFIWFSVWAAILSFGVGKWIPTVGAWGRIIVLGFFSITVVIYAIKHGVHGVHGGSFKPTYVAFIALVPILFFNYVGFELPNAAGDEMKNPQRDVPFTVIRSAIASILLYGVPILMILLVLPLSQVTSLGGFIDSIKTVFTVYGGHVGATPAQTTSPARARCSATSPPPPSSGRSSRAARPGSWAPTAPRPSPATTAPGRASSAGSRRGSARRSRSTSCRARSRASS